jgi:hypothetical protein
MENSSSDKVLHRKGQQANHNKETAISRIVMYCNEEAMCGYFNKGK